MRETDKWFEYVRQFLFKFRYIIGYGERGVNGRHHCTLGQHLPKNRFQQYVVEVRDIELAG